MAREVEGKRAAPGVLALLSKYKYVMSVLLAGIVCLAWPSKDRAEPGIETPAAVPASERQEILQLQQEMEDILSKMQGVGELRLMLTLDQPQLQRCACRAGGLQPQRLHRGGFQERQR